MKDRISTILFLFLLFNVSSVQADHIDEYYDNCDNNHAHINHLTYLGVTRISTTYGGQLGVQPGKVVVGNASLAYLRAGGGSIPRVFHMRTQNAANRSYLQYRNNHIYWHPEHRDYDAIDKFFVMTPTVGISQGSSNSETDEVNKWFQTMGALSAGVKQKLKEKGLLMPTLQMLFRKTRVADDEAYLSGAAHPGAFGNVDNAVAMRDMGASLTTATLPPLARLRLVRHDFNGVNGVDFCEPNPSRREILTVTPVSIAAIFRGREFTKKMVVSAASSYDSNNLPLTYHWRVLRGDPQKVRIYSVKPDDSEVVIEFDYTPRYVIEGSTRQTNMVVVGCFVHNGTHYSPPSFVTVTSLPNESRDYDPATKLLRSITYSGEFVDGAVSSNRGFSKDTFHYDAEGRYTGWTRIKSKVSYDFTPEGYRVLTRNTDGTPNAVQEVSYGVDLVNSSFTYSTILSQITAVNRSVTLDQAREISFDMGVSQAVIRPLAIYIWSHPNNGNVELESYQAPPYQHHPLMRAVYRPDPEFSGTDQLHYVVSDGLSSDQGIVYFTVRRMPIVPTAYDQLETTKENVPVEIGLWAEDREHAPLTYAVLTQPANGTLSGAGAVRLYTPLPNFSGTDSFTFKAKNKAGHSRVAKVTINVNKAKP